MQVSNCIPPDFFGDDVYVPSASQTMHEHFAELALKAISLAGPGGLVVDIGSNDGLFLGFVRDRGGRTLGVEPARNLTETAREKGLEVVNECFLIGGLLFKEFRTRLQFPLARTPWRHQRDDPPRLVPIR
jgi:hypothetical protein